MKQRAEVIEGYSSSFIDRGCPARGYIAVFSVWYIPSGNQTDC